MDEYGKDISDNIIPELRDIGMVSKIRQLDDDGEMPIWGTAHEYDFSDEYSLIRIPVQEVPQDGKIFHVGHAQLGVIDAVSCVPSFPTSRTNLDFSEFALNPSLNPNEWQRPLGLKRVKAISKYLDGEDSLFFSSIVLHLPDPNVRPVAAEGCWFEKDKAGNVDLVVDLKTCLKKMPSGRYRDVDFDGLHDTRPIDIVDGQHRVRGAAQSMRGQSIYCPIVITPKGMSIGEAAEVFADINIQATILKDLQKLHLRHRFSMPNAKPGDDFGPTDDDEEDEQVIANRRANIRAYELAAELSVDPNSALYKRIQMIEIEGKQLGTGTAIKATKWVELVRAWYLNQQILGDFSKTDAVKIAKAYFNAFRRVVDHIGIEGLESWGDDLSRWNPNEQTGINEDGEKSRGKPRPPYLTGYVKVFEAIISLFPLALSQAQDVCFARSELDVPAQSHHPSEDDFIAVLRPLQWIDWTENELLEDPRLGYGLDKFTSSDLYNWMSWALEDYHVNQVLYPKEEVWNPDNRIEELCLPGRGFFSPPNPDLLHINLEFIPPNPTSWFTPVNLVQVRSSPLPNTRRKHSIAVIYVGKVERRADNSDVNQTSNSGWNWFLHGFDPRWLPQASTIRIEVEVKNRFNTIRETIEFHRSGFKGAISSLGPAPPSPPKGDEEKPDAKEKEYVAVFQEKERKPIRLPPKANKRHTSDSAIYIPSGHRFEFCPIAQHGGDCKNARCVCKTVDGYMMS